MHADLETIKIVVVGDGAVGKTSLLLTYTQGKFPEEYIPTVFENYASQTLIDNKQITLSLWDTAGQESYSRLRALSYNQADGFLIVYAKNDEKSFENIWMKWIPELEENELFKVPKLIVGNKCELNSNLVDEENVCQHKQIPHLDCSAYKNIHVKEVFDTIAKLVLEQRRQVKQSIKQKQYRFCQLI